MNMYWVYDLPNWLFAVLTIAVAVAIGVSGSCATRKWVRRVHVHEHSHNDIVRFFLGAVAVLYGITLGLVAVGTWETYTDVAWSAEKRNKWQGPPLAGRMPFMSDSTLTKVAQRYVG